MLAPLNSYVLHVNFSKLVVGTQVLSESLYSSTLQSCSQVDLNEGVPDLVVDPICCGDDGPGQGCGVSSSKQKLQVVAYAGCTMVDSGQWTLLLKGNTSPKSSIRLH
jgi:hypothetical protein